MIKSAEPYSIFTYLCPFFVTDSSVLWFKNYPISFKLCMMIPEIVRTGLESISTLSSLSLNNFEDLNFDWMDSFN